jgi:hypothetical protein
MLFIPDRIISGGVSTFCPFIPFIKTASHLGAITILDKLPKNDGTNLNINGCPSYLYYTVRLLKKAM